MEKTVNFRRIVFTFQRYLSATMIFWSLYIVSSLLVSFYLASLFKKRFMPKLFFLFIIFLITPSLIEVGENNLGPAVFVFLYDLVFEQYFSIRSLRPLILTMSSGFLCLFIISLLKRRFFQDLNL